LNRFKKKEIWLGRISMFALCVSLKWSRSVICANVVPEGGAPAPQRK
jgi:hypothetical protein